jgi:hypothetical protein
MIDYATSDFLDEGVDLADPALYGPDRAPVLPALAYRSPVFGAMEDERIWTPSWVCIGTVADVPEAGDLLPYTVGAQGVHLQRDASGGLIGRYNKAQHGGCRFVPLQCQTGTKTSCSFTSCGYSRDRAPIKGAALTDTSRETFQYLGLRPERLPAVPWAAVGSLLFVNLDPAFGAAPTQPTLPAGWAPPADAARDGTHWHEVSANWKHVAQALASGDPVNQAPDNAWLHSRAATGFDALWLFPNLIIWRFDSGTFVCVLQPTATAKTLCRISPFAPPASAMPAFEARAAMAEQGPSSHSHAAAFCNRQVARHVLTGRPGYQPDVIAKQLAGAASHG